MKNQEQGALPSAAAELPAGRNLDALVAERVFGATGRRTVYAWADRKQRAFPEVAFNRESSRGLAGDFGTWVNEAGEREPRGVGFPRNYSTSIADAWAVVEKMRERTGFLLDDQNLDGGPWFASFTCDEHAEPGESGITAPLAICRAALKAVAATSEASEAPNV